MCSTGYIIISPHFSVLSPRFWLLPIVVKAHALSRNFIHRLLPLQYRFFIAIRLFSDFWTLFAQHYCCDAVLETVTKLRDSEYIMEKWQFWQVLPRVVGKLSLNLHNLYFLSYDFLSVEISSSKDAIGIFDGFSWSYTRYSATLGNRVEKVVFKATEGSNFFCIPCVVIIWFLRIYK